MCREILYRYSCGHLARRFTPCHAPRIFPLQEAMCPPGPLRQVYFEPFFQQDPPHLCWMFCNKRPREERWTEPRWPPLYHEYEGLHEYDNHPWRNELEEVILEQDLEDGEISETQEILLWDRVQWRFPPFEWDPELVRNRLEELAELWEEMLCGVNDESHEVNNDVEVRWDQEVDAAVLESVLKALNGDGLELENAGLDSEMSNA